MAVVGVERKNVRRLLARPAARPCRMGRRCRIGGAPISKSGPFSRGQFGPPPMKQAMFQASFASDWCHHSMRPGIEVEGDHRIGLGRRGRRVAFARTDVEPAPLRVDRRRIPDRSARRGTTDRAGGVLLAGCDGFLWNRVGTPDEFAGGARRSPQHRHEMCSIRRPDRPQTPIRSTTSARRGDPRRDAASR